VVPLARGTVVELARPLYGYPAGARATVASDGAWLRDGALVRFVSTGHTLPVPQDALRALPSAPERLRARHERAAATHDRAALVHERAAGVHAHSADLHQTHALEFIARPESLERAERIADRERTLAEAELVLADKNRCQAQLERARAQQCS